MGYDPKLADAIWQAINQWQEDNAGGDEEEIIKQILAEAPLAFAAALAKFKIESPA